MLLVTVPDSGPENELPQLPPANDFADANKTNATISVFIQVLLVQIGIARDMPGLEDWPTKNMSKYK